MNRKLIAIGAGVVVLTAAGVVALSLVLSAGEDDAAVVAAAPKGEALKTGESAGAGVVAPLAFEAKTEHAEIALTLPEAVKAAPELHGLLYAEGVRDLEAFAAGALADRTEMEGEGLQPMPYAKSIEWEVAAETGKLLSLQAEVYENTGGAHPNGSVDARLWDKAMKRSVPTESFFAKNADLSGVEAALCEGVAAAKKARTGEAWAPDATWPCPKIADTAFVLAPGANGRAGGLTFVIPPYAVGPYAEGAYEVTLPAATVRPHVTPAYADEFGG